MKQFIREYRIELVATFMALLGIFLLVERMEIHVTIFCIIRLAILHIRPSDLIGLVLIALSIVIVLWRVQVWLIQRLSSRPVQSAAEICTAATVAGWIVSYLCCCRYVPTAIGKESAAGEG